MTKVISLTGEISQTIKIDLPQDVRDKIEAAGLEAPKTLTLELREATIDEREEYLQWEKEGSFVGEPEQTPLVTILQRRVAEGTPSAIFPFVLRGMNQPVHAALCTAYITGEWPDPKAVAGLLRQTQTGLLNKMMMALASQELSLPPSTESTTSDSSPSVSTEPT